jgi:transcriptional regulator of NAD metabolism
MPVFRALDYCGSYPIPDKSKKPIYSDIFFDSKSSLLQAEHKRNRKKSLLEKS